MKQSQAQEAGSLEILDYREDRESITYAIAGLGNGYILEVQKQSLLEALEKLGYIHFYYGSYFYFEGDDITRSKAVNIEELSEMESQIIIEAITYLLSHDNLCYTDSKHFALACARDKTGNLETLEKKAKAFDNRKLINLSGKIYLKREELFKTSANVLRQINTGNISYFLGRWYNGENRVDYSSKLEPMIVRLYRHGLIGSIKNQVVLTPKGVVYLC